MGEAMQADQSLEKGSNGSLKTTLDIATNHSLPLEVGSLELDTGGRLRQRQPGIPYRFNFKHYCWKFEAELSLRDTPCLTLNSVLGVVPYTAESSVARRAVHDLVERSRDLDPGSLQLGLGQVLTFGSTMAVPSPRTPPAVMASVVSILIKFKPYFEVLSELVTLPPQMRT